MAQGPAPQMDQSDNITYQSASWPPSICTQVKVHQYLPVCEDREDLPLYGILIPSPSCTEVPPRRSGAGVAKNKESWEDTGAGAESYQELNLLLVVFL